MNATAADFVKFHDDKSTYTGTHVHGGPQINDKSSDDLASLVRRGSPVRSPPPSPTPKTVTPSSSYAAQQQQQREARPQRESTGGEVRAARGERGVLGQGERARRAAARSSCGVDLGLSAPPPPPTPPSRTQTVLPEDVTDRMVRNAFRAFATFGTGSTPPPAPSPGGKVRVAGSARRAG